MPTSVIETSDNKYLVSGYTYSYGAGGSDIWLLKINPGGSLDWNQTFGGDGQDMPTSVIETSDNKYLILSSSSENNNDIWLFKVNEDGSLDWNQTYGGPEYEQSISIIETSDNKYLLSAYTNSFGATYGGTYLLKIKQDGTLDWNKVFTESNSVPFSLIENTNGYLIVGRNSSVFDPDYDYGNYSIIKTNFDGNTLSNKTIGGKGTEYLFSVYKTADGGALLGGVTGTYGGILPDSCDFGIFVVKVDSSGNIPSTTNLPISTFWQGCDY